MMKAFLNTIVQTKHRIQTDSDGTARRRWAASQEHTGGSRAASSAGSRNWSSRLFPARLRTSSSWGLRRKPSRSASDGLLSLVVHDPRGWSAALSPPFPRIAGAFPRRAATAASEDRSGTCRGLSAWGRLHGVTDLARKALILLVAAGACGTKLAPR